MTRSSYTEYNPAENAFILIIETLLGYAAVTASVLSFVFSTRVLRLLSLDPRTMRTTLGLPLVDRKLRPPLTPIAPPSSRTTSLASVLHPSLHSSDSASD